MIASSDGTGGSKRSRLALEMLANHISLWSVWTRIFPCDQRSISLSSVLYFPVISSVVPCDQHSIFDQHGPEARARSFFTILATLWSSHQSGRVIDYAQSRSSPGAAVQTIRSDDVDFLYKWTTWDEEEVISIHLDLIWIYHYLCRCWYHTL